MTEQSWKCLSSEKWRATCMTSSMPRNRQIRGRRRTPSFNSKMLPQLRGRNETGGHLWWYISYILMLAWSRWRATGCVFWRILSMLFVEGVDRKEMWKGERERRHYLTTSGHQAWCSNRGRVNNIGIKKVLVSTIIDNIQGKKTVSIEKKPHAAVFLHIVDVATSRFGIESKGIADVTRLQDNPPCASYQIQCHPLPFNPRPSSHCWPWLAVIIHPSPKKLHVDLHKEDS